MNKESVKNNIIISVLMSVCFILFTYLVGNYDVAIVGESPEPVGFSKINGIFYKAEYNTLFYALSKYLGYLAILLAAFFALIGAYQLVKGKSLKAVDGEIYILGGFYVVVIAMYVLFEKLVINYRPMIIDEAEGLEASYPSSHTMLAICVILSAMVLLPKYLRKKEHINIAKIALIALMILIILFRFLSGVHWFTDILGSALLSTTLFCYYVLALNVHALRKVR